MANHVRDIVEIGATASLDRLIETLCAVRDRLPVDARPEIRLGDAGLAVAYDRAQTPEETAADARYAAAYRQARARIEGRVSLRIVG